MLEKTRQDVWTKEDDIYLGEVVVKHIKDGSTQLAAFQEAGEKLSRTAAACGFRWNTYVRKTVKDEFENAKKERLNKKKRINYPKKNNDNELLLLPPVTAVEVIEKKEVSLNSIMKDIESLINKSSFDEGEREELLRENMMLKSENFQLTERNKELETKLVEVNQVYEKLKSLGLGQ